MDPATTTFIAIWPIFIQGLALSFGLIVAIGAQNAFVLRQGLRREHIGSVVLFCATADAVLIMAGVFGMAQALGQRPEWAKALGLAGALFLAWYGWKVADAHAQSGSSAGRSIHAAQPPRLRGHRVAGRKHGSAAARALAGVVCCWGGRGQRHLVQPAGLWRPLAGALVCPSESLAGAGWSHRPDDVGVVGLDGSACLQRLLGEREQSRGHCRECDCQWQAARISRRRVVEQSL